MARRPRASDVKITHPDGTTSTSSAYNRTALRRVLSGSPLRQCTALTKSGSHCGIAATPGKTLCHIHDPSAKYQSERRRRTPDRQR